ncbi:MAG: hypothetical protein K0M69_12140 [Youngiibacter sp.]|nr:hypothetical protein [Youngiibacter sp.]
MTNSSRTRNSMRNMSISLIGYFVNLVISLIARQVFIKYLGVEYLGINGLFSAILSFLSMAELGIGGAIVYSLYKPLADKDVPKINALLGFYRKTYLAVGFAIFAIGVLLTPFLPLLIKGYNEVNVDNLQLIYVLYIIQTSATYLFSYRRAILIAEQKYYIISINRFIYQLASGITQIIVLALTHNFILFLLLSIILTVYTNYLIQRTALINYPYIKEAHKFRLDNESKNSIFKNIKALMIHRLSSAVISGTPNIVLATVIGITATGLYSNYFLIVNTIQTIIYQVFNSFTASIGNLNTVEKEGKIYNIYRSLMLVACWIGGICVINLLILINPFVEWWVGEYYVLDQRIAVIIIMNLFVYVIKRPTIIFRDAIGLFWHDRYVAVAEAILCIILSVVFGKVLGMFGVYFGIFLSSILTSFWIQPYILYKYKLKKALNGYFRIITKNIIVITVAGIMSYLACEIIPYSGIAYILFAFLILNIIFNSILLLVFWKTDEFKYIILNLQTLISRKTNTKETKKIIKTKNNEL